MIRIWFDNISYKDFNENDFNKVRAYLKNGELIENTISKNFCIEAKGDNIHGYTHLDNAGYYKFCDAVLEGETLILTCTKSD